MILYTSFVIPTICSKKYKECLELTREIKDYSKEMSSYSYYKKQNRKYIIEPERSSQCSKYIHLGISYDINFLLSSSNQATINRQVKKLQEQEKEAIAKILRLRKQQKLLRQRRREILHYSLKTLDKLDTLEQKENKEKEKRKREERESIVQRGNPQEYEDPYSDYDPTLIARLIGLPTNDLLQLSDFDPYILPIGYYSYATLDSVIVTQGSSSETPLVSQGN